MERLPSCGRWNPYDPILWITLDCVRTGSHGSIFMLQGRWAWEEGKFVEWVSGTKGMCWGTSFQHPVAFGQQQFSSLCSRYCKCLLSVFSFCFFLVSFLPSFSPYFSFSFNLHIFFLFLFLITLLFFVCIPGRVLQSLTLATHPASLWLLFACTDLKRSSNW